ncbi:MAG: ribonuclease P protein component 3 [Candidatus Methanoperedens sp.]|nr:ribonuclease P protein component 3 [Candidatus Methanoperedens sp.]MCZ7370182.1 ribonuclease P protein component 3 [Candidatus Methanoperedens sp.]
MSLFDARFYDFNLHPVPDSRDSITGLAFEARRLGYSGIAITNSTVNLETVPEQDDFSIYSAAEISCKPSKLRDEIRKCKEGRILIARNGDEEFNRAAVETDELDILLQPARFNNVLAKTAADNSIALGFNIGSIIRTRGETRTREFTIMRNNLKHARKYDMKMILASDAYSHYDLRSPREMSALAGIFGMTPDEAVNAMSATPLEILKRKSLDYIQAGVELI